MKLFSEKTTTSGSGGGACEGRHKCREIALGVALYLVSYEALRHVLFFLVGGEFAETPRDLFWEYLARSSRDFMAVPESFWAFLFVSHGVVKTFLSWGLWKGRLWAFPVSAAVFVGFVVYQLYQLTYLSSVFLWLITVFDIVLIVLILHEYKHRKRILTKMFL